MALTLDLVVFHQREGCAQPLVVLPQPPVAHFGKSEDHGSVVAFWNVAVVRPHNDAARCRASPPPSHCRSTAAACCGTGAASASWPATEQPAAGRSRESGALFSRPDVSDSRPKVLLAPCAA